MFAEQELSDALEDMDRWYALQFEELVDRYSGKAIAMVDGQMVAVAETEKEADQVARQLHPEAFPLVVTVAVLKVPVCLI